MSTTSFVVRVRRNTSNNRNVPCGTLTCETEEQAYALEQALSSTGLDFNARAAILVRVGYTKVELPMPLSHAIDEMEEALQSLKTRRGR